MSGAGSSLVGIIKETAKSASKNSRVPQFTLFHRETPQDRRTFEIVDDFEPYAYTTSETAPPVSTYHIERTEYGFTSYKGERMKKLVMGYKADLLQLKKRIPNHHEADYKLVRRIMTDRNLGWSQNCFVIAFDIEIDSKKMPKARVADRPIVCISAYDYALNKAYWFAWRPDFEHKIVETRFTLNEGKVNVDINLQELYFDNEETMLKWFLKYIYQRDPDILTGWNAEDFDVPYLMTRCEVLGIDFRKISPVKVAYFRGEKYTIEGRIVLDMLTFYKKLQLSELPSYKLDVVGQHVLRVGKVPHVVSIGELWRTALETLKSYSIRDSVLVWQIDELEQVLKTVFEMANIASCTPDLIKYNKDIVDALLMKFCHGKWVLPTVAGRAHKTYKGAIIYEPTIGMHSNVIGADVESMYPTIVIMWNMSPETYLDPEHPDFDSIPKIAVGNGVYFRTDKIGIIPQLILSLIKFRKEKQKLMYQYEVGSDEFNVYFRQQYAYKRLLNSIYGMLGFPAFRLYMYAIAHSVCFIGRKILDWSAAKARELGFEVIYGDTDSIFIRLGEMSFSQVMKTGSDVAEKITESYKDLFEELGGTIDENFRLKLAFEKVYERLLFVQVKSKERGAKKNYAGMLVWYKGMKTRQIDVVGFERSDMSQISLKVQDKVIGMVLRGKPKAEIRSYIRGIIDKINTHQFSMVELGIPMQISKALYLYTGNWAKHPHVRGCLYSNDNLGTDFGSGTKPKRVYIKQCPSGVPSTNVICVDEDTLVPEGFVMDEKEMIDTCVKAKVERVIEAMGWKWNEMADDRVQSKLSAFF